MKQSVLALAILLAGAPAARAADETPEQRGEALLTRLCANCHAVGRTGASTHPEAPAFRTLSKRYKIEALEEALGEGFISGHSEMPEFKFETEDIGAVIAYLKSIQEP